MTITKDQYLANAKKVTNLSEIGPKAVFEKPGEWIAGQLVGVRLMPEKPGRKAFKYYHLRVQAADCKIVQGKDETPVKFELGVTIVGVTGAWLDTGFGPSPILDAEYVVTFKGMGKKETGKNQAKEFVVEMVTR